MSEGNNPENSIYLVKILGAYNFEEEVGPWTDDEENFEESDDPLDETRYYTASMCNVDSRENFSDGDTDKSIIVVNYGVTPLTIGSRHLAYYIAGLYVVGINNLAVRAQIKTPEEFISDPEDEEYEAPEPIFTGNAGPHRAWLPNASGGFNSESQEIEIYCDSAGGYFLYDDICIIQRMGDKFQIISAGKLIISWALNAAVIYDATGSDCNIDFYKSVGEDGGVGIKYRVAGKVSTGFTITPDTQVVAAADDPFVVIDNGCPVPLP